MMVKVRIEFDKSKGEFGMMYDHLFEKIYDALLGWSYNVRKYRYENDRKIVVTFTTK